MNGNKKLKEILDRYDKDIDQISKEFIDELKSDSKTYSEVYRKLDLFQKEILFHNSKSQGYKDLVICFFIYTKELLENEKNDLPLTNRSK